MNRPSCAAALILAIAALTSQPALACSKTLRVAIDIGHSKSEPGAISARGRYEFNFNDTFARELVEASQKKRTLKLFLVNPLGETLELTDRTKRAAAQRAELFVSIHHDSVQDKYLRSWEHDNTSQKFTTAFSGFSVFVSSLNREFDASRKLAELISTNWKALDLKQSLHHAEPVHGENRKLIRWDLGVYDAPFAVLRSASMPAVLLELGVIANRDEEALLELPSHRQQLRVGLLDALERYCG